MCVHGLHSHACTHFLKKKQTLHKAFEIHLSNMCGELLESKWTRLNSSIPKLIWTFSSAAGSLQHQEICWSWTLDTDRQHQARALLILLPTSLRKDEIPWHGPSTGNWNLKSGAHVTALLLPQLLICRGGARALPLISVMVSEVLTSNYRKKWALQPRENLMLPFCKLGDFCSWKRRYFWQLRNK